MPEPAQNDLPIMDFHSHLLPCMDDGSRSAEMTRAMLDRMAAQGIRRVAATPHFYPERDGIERFQERCAAAVQLLFSCYDRARHPQIYLGAEVAYWHGISHAEGLDRLCLKGTRCFLLEMPVARWSDHAVKELLALREEQDLRPVLAHAERYLFLQKRSVAAELLRAGILLQCNASFFLQRKSEKKALKMLARGELDFLGSDCHDLADRAPELGTACRAIAAHGLEPQLRRMAARGDELLRSAVPL